MRYAAYCTHPLQYSSTRLQSLPYRGRYIRYSKKRGEQVAGGLVDWLGVGRGCLSALPYIPVQLQVLLLSRASSGCRAGEDLVVYQRGIIPGLHGAVIATNGVL